MQMLYPCVKRGVISTASCDRSHALLDCPGASVSRRAGSGGRWRACPGCGDRLPLLPDQVDEGAKTGGHVSMTGIIETQSREWRRPVFQHGLQASVRKMIRHPPVAHKCQTETFERSFDHQAVIVERQPARHIQCNLLAALFEF